MAEARKAFPSKRDEYISNYATDALNDDNHVAHRHYHTSQNKEDHWYEEGHCPYDSGGNGPNLSNIEKRE